MLLGAVLLGAVLLGAIGGFFDLRFRLLLLLLLLVLLVAAKASDRGDLGGEIDRVSFCVPLLRVPFSCLPRLGGVW